MHTTLCIRLLAALIILSSLAGCNKDNAKEELTIGIIEPLEHTAMAEIVAGFTDTLQKLYKKPVKIKVANAQNDANMQRAIIEKMHDANYTVILPIGVGTSQMSLAMVHDQPVVSLASDLSENDKKKRQPCNLAVVHDQISSDQLLQFIHVAYPKLTEITLVHSAADKVFPEVKETIAAGEKYGIHVNHIMVSSLPELFAAAQALPPETQGIFVLKDSLIVSGISTLAKTAGTRHIPLITSDQGSVQDGAMLALGVHEREIGVEGAKLVAAILNGKPICELPIVEMNHLTVFVNSQALQQAHLDAAPITQAAEQFHYKTEQVDASRG
jgi:putative ABC transport system substrate-binding protein